MNLRTALSSLAYPVLILSAFVILAASGETLLPQLGFRLISQGKVVAWYVIQVGIWLSAGWVVARLLNVLVWDGIVRRVAGARVPKLLKNVTGLVIATLAVTGIVGVVFDFPITGFFATSSVVGLIVGFALRNVINDVFMGVAVHIDRPFQIGDWITVHSVGGEITGCVTEIHWRTTRVRTEEGTVVILPNGSFGAQNLTNHWLGGKETREEVKFCLDFTVPVDRGVRILRNAAIAATAAGPILPDPPPHVLVDEATDLGVTYRVRYWIRPWQGASPSLARDVVNRFVLNHLLTAGVTPAYPKEDVYHSPMPVRQLDSSSSDDRRELLARVPLFSQLDADALDFLSGNLKTLKLEPGWVLIEQGEKGRSMYVVSEGVLYISVRTGGDGVEKRTGQLTPGQFFGEFSLLTGDPRETTVTAGTDAVVFEITQEVIESLFSREPRLLETIGTALADRMLELRGHIEAGPNAEASVIEPAATGILEKMKRIFRKTSTMK